MKEVAAELGIKESVSKKRTRRMDHLPYPDWTTLPETEFDFLDNRFVVGKNPGSRNLLNEADVKANLKAIEGARRQSPIALHD